MTSQVGLRTHRVPRADFELLASGYGDAGTVSRLKTGQRSKHLLLVRALLDAAPPASAGGLRAGLELLTEVQRKWPDVVADLLVRPHVGAWAAHCLRVLLNADTGSVPIETDLGHFAGIAASAAIRAGLDFDVNIPVRNGIANLPSLGSVRVRDGVNGVQVVAADGAVFVDGRRLPDALDAAETGWQPLRRLHAESGGLSLSLELDDLDPFRNCHRLDAADRLGRTAVGVWQQRIAEAWPLLVRHHRPYAEAIAAGLVSLVPLSAERSTRGVNATSMDAFGSVLVSPPVDGRGLAVALVHEFQHGKLGALLDLVPLLDDTTAPRYYAPWRDDPRPLGGLLHGAYAFMGVADFWRVQRTIPATTGVDFAHFEFARWRERVNRVLGEIAQSGHLTPAGDEFVAGMQETLDRWLAEKVPPTVETLARDAADDHYTSWRVRNLRPDPGHLKQLAKSWAARDHPPVGSVPTNVVPSNSRALVHNVRLDLVGLRISEPDRFTQLVGDPLALAAAAPGASAGDLAYAREQYASAVHEYRTLIAAEPNERAHWAGLTLALRKLRTSAGGKALLRYPEVVYGVYQELAETGDTPQPDVLADWLAGLAPDEPSGQS